jgi:Protein of unknown function (DUF3108)
LQVKIKVLTLPLIVGLGIGLLSAETPEAAPFPSGEVLRYDIVWPSGLRLGEARFTANSNQAGWAFSADISANLPVLAIEDKYESKADFSLCAASFKKVVSHGKKKQNEEVTFYQDENRALRRNLADSTTQDLTVPPCARDALTYLYSLRQELAQGRVPPPDDFNFGSQYQISVSYVETRAIESGGKTQQADRLLVDVTGGENPINIELFLAQDAARTPLLIRVPFELGTFSLKLAE